MGSSKSLVSEEAFFKSQSMQVLSTQVRSLINEVETRENLEYQLTDAQNRLQAKMNEKKSLEHNYRAGMDEVTSRIDSLKSENSKLSAENHHLRQL